MPRPEEDDHEPPLAQKLGESYASLVGSQEWHIDGLENFDTALTLDGPPMAEAVETILMNVPQAEPVEEAIAVEAAVPVESPSTPPLLAEAVTEPTVPPSPLQIIEALLFVGGQPIKPSQIAEVIRGLPIDDVREYIDVLNRVYKTQNRPYFVMQRPAGYVMQLRPKFAAMKEKMFGGPREARLNQPSLDVLSLIAYRQPVGKSEIDSIRGQDSAGVVRQLVRLGLVVVVERASGERETLYGTSERFLEIFNLRNLDDLPVVGEAKKIN